MDFFTKYILILLTSIMTVNHVQANICTSLRTIKNSLDAKVASFFGEEKLSQINELKIQKIVQDMGMSEYSIEIRKMNNFALAHTGRDNALVLPFLNYLFISEDFFEELTEQEQRFLIGHELMHIYSNHGAKRLGFLFSALAAGVIFEDRILNEPEKARKIKRFVTSKVGSLGYMFLRGLWPVGITVAGILTTFKLARSQEEIADKEVVVRLGKDSIAGGISLLEKFDEECGDRSKYAKLRGLISVQPSFKERINKLKNLQLIVII